jgi:uncharacterized membrane protein HdeD (DUF308 family)
MSATSAATFVRKSIGWSIALSVLMILAGMLAIASPLAAGLAANVFVAWPIALSGCFHLVFAWYRPSAGGFLWELLVGTLYAFTGGYLVMHPLTGLESLTIALAFYLFVEAILEFVLGVTLRPLPGSGWLLLHGIVTLILAAMIWRTWPSSTGWVIGTLVGISMLFSGASRLAISLAAHRVTTKLA